MIRIGFWTAVFLVLLRICIGWHFFAEGVNKVRSAYTGAADVNEKPFSSAGYFSEAQGPFGKFMRGMLGDPNKEIVDKLTPTEDRKSVPAPVAQEWDSYLTLFTETYQLSEPQQAAAKEKLEAAKKAYIKWLDEGTLTVEKTSPGPTSKADFELEVPVAKRLEQFQEAIKNVDSGYNRLWVMQKDVLGAELQTRKKDVSTIRKELEDAYKDQFNALKDDLASVLGANVTAFLTKEEGKDEQATLEAMLTPMQNGNNPLAAMWDAYGAHLKKFGKVPGDELNNTVDTALTTAKARFDLWLAGKDVFSGIPEDQNYIQSWQTAYTKAKDAATAEEKKLADAKLTEEEKTKALAKVRKPVMDLVKEMQAQLKFATDTLKKSLADQIEPEAAQGYASPKPEYYLWFIPKWKPIQYVDWSTRWFLAIVGCCLIIGLWSRLAAFGAGMFLLMTILSTPNVPWLPVAPLSEGNYVYINKNVIEFLALMVLTTVSTGMWAGIDAVLYYLFGQRRALKKAQRQQEKELIRNSR